MLTRSEAAGSPASSARGEAARWAEVAEVVGSFELVEGIPSEAGVVRFFDPAQDLERRALRWGHDLVDHGLPSLARFAAGLAIAEAEAWQRDQPDIATRAFSDRRHLCGDRLLHWAVPWLVAVAETHPGLAASADIATKNLFDIGDRLRPAPDLTGAEGIHPPGEDAFGPLVVDAPLSEIMASLWGGRVLLDMSQELGAVADSTSRAAVADRYRRAEEYWHGVAAEHEGSAALWKDLASRAASTAAALEVYGNS